MAVELLDEEWEELCRAASAFSKAVMCSEEEWDAASDMATVTLQAKKRILSGASMECVVLADGSPTLESIRAVEDPG